MFFFFFFFFFSFLSFLFSLFFLFSFFLFFLLSSVLLSLRFGWIVMILSLHIGNGLVSIAGDDLVILRGWIHMKAR